MQRQTQVRQTQLTLEFTKATGAILNKILLRSRDEAERANVDRLRKRLGILKSMFGDAIVIDKSYQIFKFLNSHINEADKVKRDAYFLNVDARQEYVDRMKMQPSDEIEYALSLINSAKELYRTSTLVEQEEIFGHIKTLSRCSLEYAQIAGTA
jgi:hypothetical protein